MKTALMIVGFIFFVVIFLAAGLMYYLTYVGTKLDVSSKTYVDTNLPIILAHWSTDELMKRASPQFHESASEEQVAELFAQLDQLGPLEKYEGSEGNSNVTYTTSGELISATYIANATFQNGKAAMQIKLIQIDGNWFIYGFHVDTPLHGSINAEQKGRRKGAEKRGQARGGGKNGRALPKMPWF